MKQFKDKKALDMWVGENFPAPAEFTWEVFVPDQKEIERKLTEEGYDIDNLTSNGEGYEINGHTNNGWISVNKDDAEWMKSAGYDMQNVRIEK